MLYRPDVNKSDFVAHSGLVLPQHVKVRTDDCGPLVDTALQVLIVQGGGCLVTLDGDPEQVSFVWLRAGSLPGAIVTPSGACETCGPYRVDWRGTYAVNPMAMAAFQSSMPTQPTVWRIFARLDTYFNYEFMDQQASYYSFRLHDSMEPNKPIWTYGKKGTPDAEAMFQALSDGKDSSVTVSIAYPLSKQSNEITKLVAFYGPNFIQTLREIADTNVKSKGAGGSGYHAAAAANQGTR